MPFLSGAVESIDANLLKMSPGVGFASCPIRCERARGLAPVRAMGAQPCSVRRQRPNPAYKISNRCGSAIAATAASADWQSGCSRDASCQNAAQAWFASTVGSGAPTPNNPRASAWPHPLALDRPRETQGQTKIAPVRQSSATRRPRQRRSCPPLGAMVRARDAFEPHRLLNPLQCFCRFRCRI